MATEHERQWGTVREDYSEDGLVGLIALGASLLFPREEIPAA